MKKMKSKNNKLNVNLRSMKERDVSDEELEKNKMETFRKKLYLYQVPLVGALLLVGVYFVTRLWLIMIPAAILFFIGLFGIEGNANTCPRCHKWGKVIWIENEGTILRTTTKKLTKENGEEVTKEEKEEVDRRRGRCLNCGGDVTTEKVKPVN